METATDWIGGVCAVVSALLGIWVGYAYWRYHRLRRQSAAWPGECWPIVRAEIKKGRTLETSEAWQRARQKSLELHRETLIPAKLLYEGELTPPHYFDVELFEWRCRCCESCGEVNRGTSTPRCLILSPSPRPSTDDVDGPGYEQTIVPPVLLQQGKPS